MPTKNPLLSTLLSVVIALSVQSIVLAEGNQQHPTSAATTPSTGTPAAPKNETKNITADQQGDSRSDIETTRKIRRAVVMKKSLSGYAHNVKIITLNGHVTLKGAVRSEAERNVINDKAVRIAGSGNVTNELEVVPK